MGDQNKLDLSAQGFYLVSALCHLIEQAKIDNAQMEAETIAIMTHDNQYTGGYDIHIKIRPAGFMNVSVVVGNDGISRFEQS